jgi:hypothetical protein
MHGKRWTGRFHRRSVIDVPALAEKCEGVVESLRVHCQPFLDHSKAEHENIQVIKATS